MSSRVLGGGADESGLKLVVMMITQLWEHVKTLNCTTSFNELHGTCFNKSGTSKILPGGRKFSCANTPC